MNQFICSGYVTRDIELKESEKGKKYCKFSVAVDAGYGEYKRTGFFEFISFGKTAAAIARNFGKGKKIWITNSEATIDEYTDKNGEKHKRVVFTCLSWEFGETKKAEAASKSAYAQPESDVDFMDMPESTQTPFS